MNTPPPMPPAVLVLTAWLAISAMPAAAGNETDDTGETAAVEVIKATGTGAPFQLDRVPPPSVDDAAAGAEVRVIDGSADPNGGPPSVLVDGRVPAGDDEPRANFFFRAGSHGGRLVIDLEQAIDLGAVRSYSWHRGERAPQFYTLYAADGNHPGFDPAPGRGVDPADHGWERLAEVDTRPADGQGQGGRGGGQHAVSVQRGDGSPLGHYRHVLFEVHALHDDGPFGHTFFSEIDLIDAGAEPPTAIRSERGGIETVVDEERGYRYRFDTTLAPDLADWVRDELAPVVLEWYPKIVEMLPSEGFEATDAVLLEFRDDMGGTPAYAAGNRVAMNVGWFRRQLQGEALGCVVHELVHVVQAYQRARFTNRRPRPTPSWVTEGVADYVRWFLYEPETRGAALTRRNIDRARHDASYRVSANFIDWVIGEHGDGLLQKLNTAAREGRYREELWQEWTGHPVAELERQWLEARRREL